MFGNNNQSAHDQAAGDDPQVVAPQAPAGDPGAIVPDAPSFLPPVPVPDPAPQDAAPAAESASPVDVAMPDLTDSLAQLDTQSSADPVAAHDEVSDDLLDIKQHALKQLSPLVGHLEQSPEDRFKTFMMMIQASDDKSLIKSAYEAAQGIEDEKLRAQALLDIVNEINYFTQQHEGQAD